MGAGAGPPIVLLAAGGTGGHLFPAEALAEALAQHGVAVDLATDERATRYGHAFPARATHIIPSDTLRGRDPLALLRTAWRLGLGLGTAYRLLGALEPAAVVGFGGYPSIPPVLAATLRGIPTVIHDANAVFGRANRLLAPRVTAIATSFPGVLADRPRLAAKATHTGNPLRAAVTAAAATPFEPPRTDRPLRLLVFGGSQGARVMADVVPAAVGQLDAALRARLAVTQQARAEDLSRVREVYARAGVDAEIAPFFADLPARIAAAHLIVSRSGAGTVAELAAIGRPSILVPLPGAIDQDQFANASVLEKAGGAILLRQTDFTPARLGTELAALAAAPERLAAMAAAARGAGTLDAAERLAQLVLRVAHVVPLASRDTSEGSNA
jgi:UDP-N-acetylglucosamine--N-acetylmuramyl-(pentapeptide) pyrophosphoryl-undecaprenol N-acetylglucosamine transferase